MISIFECSNIHHNIIHQKVIFSISLCANFIIMLHKHAAFKFYLYSGKPAENIVKTCAGFSSFRISAKSLWAFNCAVSSYISIP